MTTLWLPNRQPQNAREHIEIATEDISRVEKEIQQRFEAETYLQRAHRASLSARSQAIYFHLGSRYLVLQTTQEPSNKHIRILPVSTTSKDPLPAAMSNALVGDLYELIVKQVIENSRPAFEVGFRHTSNHI